jgi:hypothetical protein
MAARKKVLLKVIILGDSGYVPGALCVLSPRTHTHTHTVYTHTGLLDTNIRTRVRMGTHAVLWRHTLGVCGEECG